MTARASEFVPVLRTDLLRRDIGTESLMWSPLRTDPVSLDPAATVMLDVIDGAATLSDLADDLEQVVGVPPEVARSRITQVVERFHREGLLVSSEAEPGGRPPREIFANPVSSCMEASTCTGRVTPINLEIGGTRLRVACGSRRVARLLRKALAGHLVDEPAPLGFVIRSPRRPHRPHVLLDRCGFTLGSARTAGGMLAMVLSHLAALMPSEEDVVRLSARALLRDDSLILCAWPLLFVPSMTEREALDAGLLLLDRLAIDLDSATGQTVHDPLPWTQPVRLRPPAGHTAIALVGAGRQVREILVPTTTGTACPSTAQVAAMLASSAIGGRRESVLEITALLAESVPVTGVDPSRPGDLRSALGAGA